MKTTLSIVFGILIFTRISSALPLAEWTEDYGPIGFDEPVTKRDEKFRWLFEKLFPEDVQAAFPEESFKSFRVHLRDSVKVFPDPSWIEDANLKFVQRVQGTMTYVGIVRKKYIYDVLQTRAGKRILSVEVHLQDATEADWIQFGERMKEAELIWNENALPMDFDYGFRFRLQRDKRKAHFSVQVKDTTRGPYDQFWGRDWSGTIVAHELGHMLGLGDEYKTLSGEIDCFRPSLMCAAWAGSPMKHHYYFILRRLVRDPELFFGRGFSFEPGSKSGTLKTFN